ncbi:MAG TPA: hypothetical protein VFN44_10830 [Solirubrobacteraceae bacterium]|nr:hypothetical protein [Solirubrobacteraceae bacterium]
MRVLPLALLLALAIATPAAADSLVYVKDSNVWSARPDGSEQRQLTKDGIPQDPYSSPSQADDGTIVAVRGTRLYKIDPQGRAAGTLNSLLTDKPGSIGAVGPFDARISPDGRTIAYWIGIMGGWYDYATNTYYNDPESAVAFQDAADGHPVGSTMFFEEPSWLPDSKHVLLFESMNGFAKQVYQGEAGVSHNDMTPWFHDSDTQDDGTWFPLGAGELNRAGNRLAALRAGGTMGDGYFARGTHNGIVIFDVHGFDQAPTRWPCWINDDNGGEITPPSWGPDGDSLAYSAPDGIWVAQLNGSCDKATNKLVIPGGREPDWGPAKPASSPGSGSQPQPPTEPGAGAGAAIKVRVAGAVRRAALLKRGLAVKVDCPVACKVAAVAKARGKRVAKARTAGSGTVRATLKPRRRALGRARTLDVTVTVRAGAVPLTVKKRVRLR